MRLTSRVEAAGLNQLNSKFNALRELPATARVPVLLAGAGVIVGLARQKAPVKTGFLRDHIKAIVTSDLVQIISAALYSSFQEFGTRFQKGTPFMRPAFDEGYRPAIGAMVTELKRQIARIAR